MTSRPIGDLCVLPDTDSEHWEVSICWSGVREHLGRFDDKHQATEFAVAVRDRRAQLGQRLTVHIPDDCPCEAAPPH